MWDMATPIVVGERHVGNLFLGQFFFSDEKVDRELFKQQAQRYGFDEEAYLAALDRVPRWSKQKVETAFRFYTRFANILSQLSHSNLKLARSLTEKDRLLAAHRESERKFSSYVENAPYGIFVTDQKGRYLEVNETACRLTGYNRDELLAMSIFQLAPSDQRALVRAHFRTAVQKGRAVGEKPFVTKEGRQCWWSVTTIRLSDTRFLSYKDEVTDRRRAREAMRLNQRRLKALLDLSQMQDTPLSDIADFVLEKAVQLTKSDQGFLGFVSEGEEEMVLHAWSDEAMVDCQVAAAPRHFPIDAAGVWAEAVRQRCPLMLNDYTAPHPKKKGYPDGHVALTRLLSVPVLEDGRVRVIVVVANKAERYDENDQRQIQLLAKHMLRLVRERKARKALQKSEERYRMLYESIRDAILVANTDREVISCNPAFTDLFGYTLDEIRGRKTRLIYEDEEEFNLVREILEERQDESNFFFTPNYRKKSGTVFPGETNLFYLRDDAGEVQGFIGLVRDITARRQAQKQIATYAADLERSNRELEQFAYVVSHDLQEPVRTVKNWLGLLEDRYRGEMDERAERYIDHAVDGARRMQEMIRALLDLSRVGTRGQELAPTDLEVVLGRTLRSLRRVIEDADAQVTCDSLPTVMADRAQLAQVFQNLVANAIKFRREGVPPRVHVSAKRQGDEWVFSVADNGIGIDPQQTERIFEVFQRLHTDEEYPGLGMGLALCKRIVERHGGRIWVESEPGQGSMFCFTLPATRCSQQASSVD
jgi:PAS domain S-box-containing protein